MSEVTRIKGQFQARDITGQSFGKFRVLSQTNKKANDGAYLWTFQCCCGNVIERTIQTIKNLKSCGCIRENKSWYQEKDLRGFRNFMVTAIEPTEKRGNGGYVVWKMRCDCGNEFERSSYYLTKGFTKSCGCKRFVTGRPRIADNGAHINTIFSSYKRSAKDRNIEFLITKEQAKVLFETNCFYCGIVPTVSYTHSNLSGNYAWNGIDRKDNSKGYTIENCVACCKMCNFAKSNHSIEDFTTWIKRAYKHLKLG